MIHDEIKRLEKLQRLAEKIHQEAKHTDSKLDDIEAWIEDEAKRVDTLHPKVLLGTMGNYHLSLSNKLKFVAITNAYFITPFT